MTDRQSCLTCNFWFAPTPIEALATDTRGACLAIGSPYEEPTAEQVCQLWTPIEELAVELECQPKRRRTNT